MYRILRPGALAVVVLLGAASVEAQVTPVTPLQSVTRDAGQVVAEPPVAAAPPAAVSPPVEEGALAAFNGYMHSFNLWAWQTVDAGSGWFDWMALPDSARVALGNILMNYVNEPVSMLSWAVAGDYDNVAVSAQRFWTNTTRGWLGVRDVASAEGVKAPQIDIGLALCARGVGEGAYVVLPFVGPRTVRDGLSDFLLVNALTYLTLSPFIGFPPSLETFVFVEVAEEAGRIAVMRQIDHGQDRNASPQDVKDSYLAARRERCNAILADRGLAPAAPAAGTGP